MIQRRPALLLPFFLALSLHVAGAVCITRLAGPPSNRPGTPSPVRRLRIELQSLPPAPAGTSARLEPVTPAPIAAPPPPELVAPAAVAPTPPEVEATAAPPPRPAPQASSEAPTRPAPTSSPETSGAVAGSEDEGSGFGDATAPPMFAAAPSEAPAWVIDGQIAPRYPLLSRLRREEGRVVVRVALDAAGRPIDGTVETPSGYAALDRAALSAVNRATWSVRPGTPLVNATTNAIVRVPIDFRLEPGGS